MRAYCSGHGVNRAVETGGRNLDAPHIALVLLSRHTMKHYVGMFLVSSRRFDVTHTVSHSNCPAQLHNAPSRRRAVLSHTGSQRRGDRLAWVAVNIMEDHSRAGSMM